MRNKSNIDHFFELVKQNPPLIEIDQVHQIITSPKAKARTKGKRNNLLKFTIMTTIFGLIISAVVFWPNTDSEVMKENSKLQAEVHNTEILSAGSQATQTPSPIERAEIEVDSMVPNQENLHSDVYADPFFKEVFLTREQKDSVGTQVVTEKISQQSIELFPQVVCAVANEAPSLSKFEIDIYGDIELQNVRNSKAAPPKNCLWLSVKSDNGSSLSSGEYTYTEKGFNFRQPFTFSGALVHNNFEHKFRGGVLTIERNLSRITISYDIILENDSRLEGQYEGEFIKTYDEKNANDYLKIDIYGKPSQRIAQNHIAIKTYQPEPVQPIDGSRFILRLSDDELRKIGFEVNDTMISYFKCLNGRQIVYNYKYIEERTSGKRLSGKTPLQVSCTSMPCQGTTNIYPSGQTNEFFSDLWIVDYYEHEDFYLVNDTLIPIILPLSKINSEVMNEILWFAPSPDLLTILSEKHKPIIDEFLKYKQAKQAFPKTDLICYQAPKLIEESKILVLSTEELTKIGFQFSADSTVYKGRIIDITKKKSQQYGVISNTDIGIIPNDEGSLAVIITRKDGSPYETYGQKQFLFPCNKQYGSQFPLLIPVLMKSKNSLFEEDVIFWFYPTNAFFNSLPTRISTELRKEYNYVIAENKSQLEKPECKYFDECKNTLKISNFKVYPNPANNVATVSFTLPEAVNGRITLIDLTGRERQVLQPTANYSAGSHQFDVDLSAVSSGIYLVALYADKGIQIQRLVVSR